MGSSQGLQVIKSVIVCFAVAFCAFAGCEVGPTYRAPKQKMPSTWVSPPTTQASVTLQKPIEIERWWTTFNDPTLNSLITRAVAFNLNLQAAAERVREARASLGNATSTLFPTVNAVGAYNRSFNARGGSTVVTGAGGSVISTAGPKPHDLWQAGFDATWELDVFGGVKRSVEASYANLQASIEDRRDVLVTLLAEVATDYITLRGFQQEVVIAEENLVSQIHTADVTRTKVRGGFTTELDVANADAQVATTRSQIAGFAMLEQQEIYSLSVLLGQEPTALERELAPREQIPIVPPTVPVGLPSELLRRRPDIRRTERQLAAATANIGVATAQLFPQFNLTGSFTLQGTQFKSLGNLADRLWSFGPSVSWPIFDAGHIWMNIEIQNSVQAQALIAYRSTVLQALLDVENALVAYADEQQRRAALADAVTANQKAVGLATRRYDQGLTDFLNVLDAERSLYSSQDALVQSNRAVGTDLAALYKALGGGWEIGEPSTTQPVRN
jgi:NodT family efflux transporter outer membrane factor (OMF) lipoprotein